MQTRAALFAVAFAAAVAGCGTEWNDPYPAADRGKNFLYSSFIDRPKTLDPARSYTSDEWGFIQQIYEPPLQYHYLKRPYELVPQSALEMPRTRLLDAAGQELPPDPRTRSSASSRSRTSRRPARAS
jgi:oligopeptide transport system substrate-binding protein